MKVFKGFWLVVLCSGFEEEYLLWCLIRVPWMALPWEQLVTSIYDCSFLDSTALGRLVPTVKHNHQLWGNLQHKKLNVPVFTSHFHLAVSLHLSCKRKQGLRKREGGMLKMLWLAHFCSILFHNMAYFKIFCHLGAAIPGAFQLIKQEWVPHKSTGRNINSPVEKGQRKKEGEFLGTSRLLASFHGDKDPKD